MATDDIEIKEKLELLRQQYSQKIGPLLDNVDAMLKEATTHEHALRTEIAQLRGLPAPPNPTPWVRSSIFDTRLYLQAVDFELAQLNK